MPAFEYDAAIAARFPTIVGGVLHATGVANGPAREDLTTALRAEADVARSRLADTPLSDVPSLAAWRRAFRGFGVDPTQYRSAAEALLRRLVKQGELPAINALVDLANLVSIRYALPVAVFDIGRVAGGGLRVALASGDEPWADLGASQAEHPDAGEVVFLDRDGVVHARRWCWRQSAASAARAETAEVLVTVEGHHESAEADVRAAVADLEVLLRRFTGPRTLVSGLATATSPQFLSPA